MKQTAVEWLKEKTSDMTIHKTHLNDTISEWQDGYNVALEDVIKLLNQALEMEKQQIIDAYDASQTKCVNTANNVLKMLRKESVFEINATESEQYYNETYKKP